jgi:hypothetical protein
VKKYPQNNFSTVRPIFTINTPIDSGQQAEICGIIKKFTFEARGTTGNFFVKYPKNKFSVIQPINIHKQNTDRFSATS